MLKWGVSSGVTGVVVVAAHGQMQGDGRRTDDLCTFGVSIKGCVRKRRTESILFATVERLRYTAAAERRTVSGMDVLRRINANL